LFVLLLSLAVLSGCGQDETPEPQSYSGATMGTTYHVRVFPGEATVPADIGDGIRRILNEINRSMSTYLEDSELNRLNRTPVGEPFAVSPALLEVLVLAGRIHRLTGGAFDPTVGPLVDLWGFGPEDTGNRVPGPGEIAELVGRHGIDKLEVREGDSVVVRRGPVRLDLSAIAKGYAVDRVSRYLVGQGLNSHMVEVGGELYLSGVKPSGEPWRIAVERPRAGARQVQRVLALSDAGLATSGDYRNFFEKDGKRYSHTIDPRTGYPIDHGLASVTVVADTSARADALATAFMVMGPDAALALADSRGIPVYLVVKDDEGFVDRYNVYLEPYLTEVD
jgi:thiamine biosynthesis lipoprotein